VCEQHLDLLAQPSQCQDFAIWRAMSRAPSWTERGILLAGSFAQQRGFNGQAPQSRLPAR